MSLTPVPKPSNAGEGKPAIAKTSANYVNLRTGPGTNYDDIGDILNNTIVLYYPESQTSSGWVWLEQYGSAAGWVATSVIEFASVDESGVDATPTPYDGNSGIWFWKGEVIPETTIAQYAENMKRLAPNLKGIWVKVGDGSSWQGQFDRGGGEMAVNGPADVDRWVSVLSQYGLEFHAWCVLKGVDIDGEGEIITQTCLRNGVKSMILDVEPYEHYWEAGREPIRPLMTRVRQAVGGDFHIGLGVDPRQWHYSSIFPDEWFPFVNSVHMMCYWKTFRRAPVDVLEEAYRVWGGYGRPLIPILQGDAAVEDQREAHAIATQRFRAKALSWWRYGVIDRWDAVNTPIDLGSSTPTDPTEQAPPGTQYGAEQIIFPGRSGHRKGTYTGQEEFIPFDNTFGWESFYTSTEPTTSKVWSEWKTDLTVSGVYQISVFVPARHASSKKARYKIHGIKGTTTEVIVDINQSIHSNEWVSLGVFDLVKGAPNAGKVFLNDVTGESGREIAFDAVRLRQIVQLEEEPKEDPPSGAIPEIINGVYVADGYDSPVGSVAERKDDRLWPPGWADASPFGRLYFVGTAREAYHTGADLNWGRPYEDKGMPIYAVASGVVVSASRLRVWGNVIVIRHDPLKSPTGKVIYARYAHVQNIKVSAGQRVKRGDLIAEISDAFGTLVPHLHFDLSPTTVLESNPADWPGKSSTRIFRDYIDPLDFIKENRPSTGDR